MFYLYFVLPPVLIAISLALIIFLVSRKSLEIEKEIISNNKSENRLKMEFKSRWLHFLEKIAHWFKIFSLRIHNWIEKRLVFIKTQKNEIESDLDKKDLLEENRDKIESFNDDIEVSNVVNSGKVVFSENENNAAGKNSMDVVRGGKINRFRSMFTKKEKAPEVEPDDFFEFKEERIMISKEAVYPEEKKEELENILVERIATDPRDIEAYERLGDYYVSQGNRNDAEACYKQVLKLNPQSLSVRNKLSRFKRQRF